MTEAEWLACVDPEPMLKYLLGPETVLTVGTLPYERNEVEYHEKRASDRKLRLFAVACCHRIWLLISNSSNQRAVEVAERFADGHAEPRELQDAYRETQSIWVVLEFEDSDRAREAASWSANATPAAAALSGARAAAEALGDWRRPDRAEMTAQAVLMREIFGNPFRPVAFSPSWRTSTAVALAAQMYESREFSALPILADALQDAGCDNTDVLNHCRGPGPHVRGCWVVDLVLGKE